MPTYLEFDGETGHVWAFHIRPRGAEPPAPGPARGVIEHDGYSRDDYVDVAAPSGPSVRRDAALAASKRTTVVERETGRRGPPAKG